MKKDEKESSTHPTLRWGALAIVALSAGVAASPQPAEAQSAQEILSEALALHEERLAGVDDVTIRQEVMGMSTVTHMVKEEADGRPVLRVQSVDGAEQAAQGSADLTDAWADPAVLYEEWGDRWSLAGEGSVDGRATWQLELTDFEGIDWEDAGLEGDDTPLEPERLAMELAQDDLVPLRLHIQGEVVEGGSAQPMDATIHFSDYRDVAGYLHPHRMVMETDATALGLTDDEMAQALEELQNLPPQQREAMQQMMGEEMDFLLQLLDGEGLRLEVVVTDLQVNAGAP